MKKIMTLTLGLAAVLGLSISTDAMAQKIDTSESIVKWTGYGVGKSHWGHVQIKSAELKFEKKEPKSGEVVIDLNSIQAKDLEGEWADKLNGHLKGADFFNVEKHPVASFKTSSITKQKDGSYKVDGKLTIKDKTHDKSVLLKMEEEKKQKFLVGTLKFDRSKFDVKYNSDAFFDVAMLGDKLIKNDIDLELKLAVQE